MSFSLDSYSFFFFDFDGLLVNTEQLHYEAYQTLIEDRGFDFPISFLQFAAMAHTSSSALREFLLEQYPALKETPWEVLYEEKQAHYRSLLEQGEVAFMPGAEAIVELLLEKDKALCVVTNSPASLTEMIQDMLPTLQRIPHWITRETYREPKPAPDAYRAGLKKLHADPNKSMGFEDSLRGIRSVQSAGIQPVLICDCRHPQMSDPLLASIPTFETFIDLIEHL